MAADGISNHDIDLVKLGPHTLKPLSHLSGQALQCKLRGTLFTGRSSPQLTRIFVSISHGSRSDLPRVVHAIPNYPQTNFGHAQNFVRVSCRYLHADVLTKHQHVSKSRSPYPKTGWLLEWWSPAGSRLQAPEMSPDCFLQGDTCWVNLRGWNGLMASHFTFFFRTQFSINTPISVVLHPKTIIDGCDNEWWLTTACQSSCVLVVEILKDVMMNDGIQQHVSPAVYWRLRWWTMDILTSCGLTVVMMNDAAYNAFRWLRTCIHIILAVFGGYNHEWCHFAQSMAAILTLDFQTDTPTHSPECESFLLNSNSAKGVLVFLYIFILTGSFRKTIPEYNLGL